MKSRAALSGFTLVEMAMVLVIMGLVMLTVFPALTAVRSANQVQLTQSNLHSLMLATAAYVQANGCLPCPAIPRGALGNFGKVGNGVACGTCTAPEGIVPFVSLGLPVTAARDGWGHWITMRVDPNLTALPANTTNCGTTCTTFVPPSSICTQNDYDNNPLFCVLQSGSPVGASDKGLCRYNLSASRTYASVAVPGASSQKAAVIFVSHGANGYGSYYAQSAIDAFGDPPRMSFPSGYATCASCDSTCSTMGGAAICNASGTSQFVDGALLAGTYYDDILAYADRNTLVAMFGNGSCQTVW